MEQGPSLRNALSFFANEMFDTTTWRPERVDFSRAEVGDREVGTPGPAGMSFLHKRVLCHASVSSRPGKRPILLVATGFSRSSWKPSRL